jgi:hypothetical protein
MADGKSDSNNVFEPRVVYRVGKRTRNLAKMREAARKMDELRQRHADDPSDGKDVVALLRELRDR